jgi:hypothetical protein
MYENKVRFLVSYMRARYRRERALTNRSAIGETWRFAAHLVRKKARALVAPKRPA